MSKVYVGTYRKYNEGSLKGDWLDLNDYSSKDEFIEACRELHEDEDDPELMFQDWEDIPANFIGESTIDEKVWDWLQLSNRDKETVSIYLDEIDRDAPVQDALECYEGEFDSEEDWAADFWDHTGMLNELPEFARNYINYEQIARDARLGGDINFVRKGRKVRAFRPR
jgi:antirestriction protein